MGSMAQWNNQQTNNPGVPGSTQGNYCFSLALINNLINDKSKHMKK